MMNRILRGLDFFLPRSPIDGDARTRMRIFVIYLLIGFVANAYASAAYISLGQYKELTATSAAITWQIIMFAALRAGFPFEWTAVTNSIIAMLLNLFLMPIFQINILSFGLQTLPLSILFGFIIVSSFWPRVVLASFVILTSTYITFHLVDLKVMNFPGHTEKESLALLVALIVIKNILIIFILSWYAYIQRRGKKELFLTASRQLSSMRSAEIANVLRAIVSNFIQPLDELDHRIPQLLEERRELTAEDLRLLESSIVSMMKSSQSIGWLYRAYREESLNDVNLFFVTEQLDLLLKGRSPDLDCSIELSEKIRNTRLTGPVPMLLLLILNLVEHIANSAQEGIPESQRRRFQVKVESLQERVAFLLRWPRELHEFATGTLFSESNRSPLAEENFRLEMIADLVNSTKAELEIGASGEFSYIELSGLWAKA